MGMTTDELYFKPRLQVINQDQIEQIHCATLEVLERTGVDIPHDRALEILSDNGATVEGTLVRMPSWMIEAAIQTAPSRIVLGTRTGKRTDHADFGGRGGRRSGFRGVGSGNSCP